MKKIKWVPRARQFDYCIENKMITPSRFVDRYKMTFFIGSLLMSISDQMAMIATDVTLQNFNPDITQLEYTKRFTLTATNSSVWTNSVVLFLDFLLFITIQLFVLRNLNKEHFCFVNLMTLLWRCLFCLWLWHRYNNDRLVKCQCT